MKNSIHAHSTDQFDYPLPEELIAQVPSEQRDRSRLLVVERGSQKISHHSFHQIGEFLPEKACMIRNNVSVLPARLRGFRPTGGKVECLLLSPADGPATWWCLVKPGRKLSVGSTFGLQGEYTARILEVNPGGERLIRFTLEKDSSVTALANRLGSIPLPPYIERTVNDPRSSMDMDRYQTIYSDRTRQLAVAAPTAGLHFSPDLLASLEAEGVKTADLTLHIGAGTFQPIQTERIEDHAIHQEAYEIPPETQKIIRKEGPEELQRIAVGTTSARAMEDYSRKTLDSAPIDHRAPFAAKADIFIYPPFTFRAVDALITNFHLPRSTLLCLVSAFLTPGREEGIAWLKEIYAEAIARRYRFYSYGDAMLIL